MLLGLFLPGLVKTNGLGLSGYILCVNRGHQRVLSLPLQYRDKKGDLD